jgi:hypothetical protein
VICGVIIVETKIGKETKLVTVDENMKTSLSSTGIAWVGLGLVCGLMTAGGGLNALAQAPSTEKAVSSVSSSASTGVSVSTVNGQAVVTLNGKEVYSGPAKGKVSSHSRKVDGVEYCAVYDGDTVVWENVPGAAQQLQSAAGGATGFSGAPDQQQLIEQQRKTMERMQAEQQRFLETHGMSNSMKGAASSSSRSGGSSWSVGSSSASSGSSRGGGQTSSQSGSATTNSRPSSGP